mmetsp:Transcript_21309/g.37304  ORF Transcript_21309/g.37304 Transcript_21309/m.37304 type:complete len:88 (+) Transcript_21309:91-354(+)
MLNMLAGCKQATTTTQKNNNDDKQKGQSVQSLQREKETQKCNNSFSSTQTTNTITAVRNQHKKERQISDNKKITEKKFTEGDKNTEM